MRKAFALSSIAHAAFLTLVILPGYERVRYAGLDVINVNLVTEEKAVEAPKPPAPVVKEEKVIPKVEPAESKMAYKAEVKKKETKPAETKSSGRKQAATKPSESPASGTKAEGEAKIRVDDQDFRFAYYLEIIKERISSNWSPPPVTGPAGGIISTVYFKISRDGRISDIKVEQSSGADLFDRSATRAVDLSSPLPPLPAGFGGGWLGVHFEFEQRSG